MWPFDSKKEEVELKEEPKREYVLGVAAEDEAKSKSEYRGAATVRVKKESLEIDYARDPVCFAGVNWLSALTGANGHDLDGEESDVKIIKDFLDRVRFESWIKRIATHLAIYGVTFNEIVPNKEKTIIAGLRPIDPKSMDFSKKDIMGREVLDLDGYGKPKFYVQHPQDWNGRINEGIKFKPDEILYIPMRMIADSLWGVGVLEPIHEITKIKVNIERALGEAIYRLGFPIPITYCGDALHEPSPNDLIAMSEKMKHYSRKTNIALAYYNKVDAIDLKIQGMRANLDYYVDQQITGIGIPKSIITGTGEGTNRSTLEQLTDVGARNIEAIHRAIEEALNTMIFRRMQDEGQISGRVTLKFRPSKIEQNFETINAIVALVQAGVVTPEPALEDFVREYLEVPEREGEFAPKKPADWYGVQAGEDIVRDIMRKKY